MTIYSAYDQIADLLATLGPTKVIAMKASVEMQERFNQLVAKSTDGQLTRKEKDELDHYVVLERLIRLAKIRSHSDNELS